MKTENIQERDGSPFFSKGMEQYMHDCVFKKCCKKYKKGKRCKSCPEKKK